MHSHNYETLVEAQQGLIKNGFTEEFVWKNDQFTSENGEILYTPTDLTVVHHYRFEGMTNPADSSILLALKTNNNVKGYVISGYGTYADEKFVKFLDEVPINQSAEVDPKP